jgi:hypothetical protein
MGVDSHKIMGVRGLVNPRLGLECKQFALMFIFPCCESFHSFPVVLKEIYIPEKLTNE